MFLANIKIWNFRKYGSSSKIDLSNPNLDLNFTKGLNVLIGENDSGKTAIVDAIKLVLKTHSYEWIKLDDNDFFDSSNRFRIELRFEDMEKEAFHFTEWLGFEGQGDEAKPYLRIIYDVSRTDHRILPTDICAGVDIQGTPLKAAAREYLKATYLKPLRDANLDLTPKKNSRLSNILQTHEAFENKDEHRLVFLFQEFNENVAAYFKGLDADGASLKDDIKGKELKDKIDTFVKLFIDENHATNFDVTNANLKSILEKLELQILDQINPGLGTMNKLFMATELLHLEKDNWTGLRLGLIEELEAHLHPQAQMKVIEALQNKQNIQLILTTHSPNLVSKVKLENIIICHNKNAYPLNNKHTLLDPDDYKHLERFLDTTKANLFFAKGVIMVEGWSEEILIPALARKMKKDGLITKDLTEAGVSIVNVASAEFIKFAKIFLRQRKPCLNLPVAIITDVDVPAYEKELAIDSEGKAIKKGKNNTYNYLKCCEIEVTKQSLLEKEKIKEEFDKQSTRVFVTESWTLEYSLLISSTLGEHVESVLLDMFPKIDTSNYGSELAKKLLGKDIKKTEFSYQLANLIDPNSDGYDDSIKLDETDQPIASLMGAIKYVCN
ncbi:AAA family ATPase [Psychromonas sp. SP041]|uniref:ATP-dependent nuclease n=1 Tax=Psychromonas sp. SP041 TaxID=1365007 RepID=UPI0010C7AB8E|nr:AAA family ATPase [Psychromonas sp. SP041]